jgi:hypothetical protein
MRYVGGAKRGERLLLRRRTRPGEPDADVKRRQRSRFAKRDHREGLVKDLKQEFRELLDSIAEIDAHIGDIEEDMSRNAGFYSSEDIRELTDFLKTIREQIRQEVADEEPYHG